MLACPILTVPAGTSVLLSGQTFAFSCSLSGANATWQEQGGPILVLDNTVHRPTSDTQPFGDILFTADATSPLRIYYAKSPGQADRIEPPVGDQAIYSGATGGILTAPAAPTNLKNLTGTVVTGTPIPAGASLFGGIGQVQSITLASVSTGTAGTIQVAYGGVVIGGLAISAVPGTISSIELPNVNPSDITITLTTTSATPLPFSITALYA